MFRKYAFIVLDFLLFFILYSCTHQEGQTFIPDKIRVGVFNGNGASAVCVYETIEALQIDSAILAIKISASEIALGKLNEIDVLVFPGGSGSKEMNNLGSTNAMKVKEFATKKGKGVVGICAGGYMLASTPDYPDLKLMPVHSLREYYDRGRGLISFSVTPEGLEIFPELAGLEESFVQYYDGPIYVNIDSTNFSVLAIINSDIHTKKGYPEGVSTGKPAFGVSYNGEGRAIMSTGHPEATPGMRWMIPRMARWAANKEMISYQPQLVDPEKYTCEVLYSYQTNTMEKSLFWELSSDTVAVVTTAIDSLNAINSRSSIRWTVGLLRHSSPVVRIKAADYLLATEYTYAIPDVEAAHLLEKEPDVKTRLAHVLATLKSFTH